MKIEKEYDVQGLADKVKGCIKTVCETKSRNVSLVNTKSSVRS